MSRKGLTYEQIYGPDRAKEIAGKMSMALSGRVMYIPTEETRKKISLANIGNKHSRMTNEVKIKISNSLKGRKLTDIHIEKLRVSRKVGFKGKHHTIETRKKISESIINSKSYTYKNNNKKTFYYQLRKLFEYKEWRRLVFIRDNFTCIKCKLKGCYLEAHHKEPLKNLINTFLNEFKQFSIKKDIKILLYISSKWEPFWEVKNGETLCKDCHDFITYNYCNRL